MARRSTRNGRSAPTRLLSWFLIAFLAISPIPLGSTPPLAWTIWALLLGLVTFAYCLTQFLRRTEAPTFSTPAKVALGLFTVLCGYLIVQALPIGRIFGPFLVSVSDGSQIAFDTISVAPGDTWLMLIRMISFAMLFFLVSQVAREKTSATRLLVAISIIVTAHAFYGIVALYQLGDTLVGAPKWKYFGDATGTFLNRNTYATYLALGIGVTLALAARSLIHHRHDRIRITLDTTSLLYLIAAAIIVTTVVLTNSRAGLVVNFAAAFVVLIATLANNAKALRPLIVVTPIALVLFAGMFLTFGETIWRRFEDSAVEFDFRLELYKQVVALIAERPLLGFGGGAFEQAFPIVHTGLLRNELTWDEAHNTYLELWADLGLIFGSIPIVLVAGLALVLVSRLVRGEGSWVGQASALAAIAAAGLHALLDFSLEIEAVAFLFVAICAIGLASSQMQKSKE